VSELNELKVVNWAVRQVAGPDDVVLVMLYRVLFANSGLYAEHFNELIIKGVLQRELKSVSKEGKKCLDLRFSLR
jgi:hypothetical protein